MSVITLTPPLLDAACCQLARQVNVADFSPQVVIGVLNGGAQVARIVYQNLQQAVPYCEVRVFRPSSRNKEKVQTRRLLQLMPLWLCDLLRILESRVAEWRSSKMELQRLGTIVLTPEVEARLSANPCRVLIIDDAIDTGATIQVVRQQLLEKFPHLEIKVASVTVTTPHPMVDADFSLYHNRTLCRFPWSSDYRG